jgi:hypothetical protein
MNEDPTRNRGDQMRSFMLKWPAGLLFTAVLAPSTIAVAADPPAPRAARLAVRDAADDWFDKGSAAYDAHKLKEAEAAFFSAWSLKKTPDIAANLAQVKVELGKHAEAATFFAYAVKNAAPTDSQDARRDVKQRFEEERKLVGALRIRVNVEGAEVRVNGRVVGNSPLADEVFVDAGTAQAQVQRDGYLAIQQSIVVPKGEAREVSLVLTAAPGPTGGRSIVPGAVLVGVGGAALATGVALMVVAAGKRAHSRDLSAAISNAHHSCVANASNYDPTCSDLNDTALSTKTFHNAGIGLLAGAGAAAVGATVYFLWPASTPSRASTLRVSPTVSVTTGGLLFSGSF